VAKGLEKGQPFSTLGDPTKSGNLRGGGDTKRGWSSNKGGLRWPKKTPALI